MTYPRDIPDRRRKALRFGFSLVAAAVLLFLLLRGVEWEKVRDVLKRLSPLTWLAVFGVHASIYVLRTLRFASLIPDRRVPFPHLWSIQAANQMAAQLLPMRTGEITYPIYLRNAGVPLEVGVAGLIVSRALDLLAVLTITVFSAIYVGTPIQQMPKGTGIPMVLSLALTAAALLAVATGGAPFIRAFAAMFARLGASHKILGRVEQVARGFETVGRNRAIAEAFLLTLLIWIGVDLFYWILMNDLGFGNLGPVEVAFGASAAILTNLLPVNTFAGIGTQEWGWSWGFQQLGLATAEAAATALAVHAVQLVNVGILGLIAQFRLSPKPRHEQERAIRWLANGRAKFKEYIRSIPPDLVHPRPSPESWSVVENLQHLAKVENAIINKMREVFEKPGDVQAGRRVRIPIWIVSMRTFLRFEAPPHVRPDAHRQDPPNLEGAIAELDAVRARLVELLQSADDSVLRGKRFGHRVLGALDLIEWAWFIGRHERRHQKQIEQALRALRSRQPEVRR
ncbi:MAG: flippase-like domain-containing protein [Planctomycetes bacterium]|nr:flippase-like domain-containing protein [Planctomycetota bacterium]